MTGPGQDDGVTALNMFRRLITSLSTLVRCVINQTSLSGGRQARAKSHGRNSGTKGEQCSTGEGISSRTRQFLKLRRRHQLERLPRIIGSVLIPIIVGLWYLDGLASTPVILAWKGGIDSSGRTVPSTPRLSREQTASQTRFIDSSYQLLTKKRVSNIAQN
jgi:hypothetical protein